MPAVSSSALKRRQSSSPAHARKPEVEHDRVGPVQPDGLEGGFRGPGLFHLDVHDLEGRAEKRPKRGVVVDDQ